MTLQFATFWTGDTAYLKFHEVYDEVADERWYKAIDLLTFLGFKDTDAHVKDESKQNWGSLCEALNIQLKAHEGVGREQNAKEILEQFSSIPKNTIFINFSGLLELCFTTENPLLANTKRWMVNELGAKIKRLQSQPAQTLISNTVRDTLANILNTINHEDTLSVDEVFGGAPPAHDSNNNGHVESELGDDDSVKSEIQNSAEDSKPMKTRLSLSDEEKLKYSLFECNVVPFQMIQTHGDFRNAGCVYTGRSDEVGCLGCSVIMKEWHHSDRPLDRMFDSKHRKDCSMIGKLRKKYT